MKCKITSCKYRGHQVNQGIWWCERQFDKDFLKMLSEEEREIIYACDCNICPFIDSIELKWEMVSEI